MTYIQAIPKKYLAGFNALISIDDTTFEAILSGLANTPAVYNERALAEGIQNSTDEKIPNLEDILGSVGSLVPLSEKENYEIELLAADISNIILSDSLEPSDEQKQNTLTKRIIKLFQNEHLYVSSKAYHLAVDSSNVYLAAKVVSDIRPVFGRSVLQPPTAGMIIHNLNIHFQSGEESKHCDLYVALDSNDLDSLIGILLRARDKEKSLRDLMKKANLTNVSLEL